jgi:putative sporulation protein YtxC
MVGKGGTPLINIFFKEADDAKKLFDEMVKSPQCHWRLTYDEKVVAVHFYEGAPDCLHSLFIPVFTKWMIKLFESRWLLMIITHSFYYEDEEERQQILQLAHSFIDGERHDYRMGKKRLPSREQLIEQALREFLHDGLSFSFESFVKFRLKEYYDRLVHYVELAIDEYKLEQEYQNFVQMLRDIVADRSPQMDVIHLLHKNGSFHFFDEHFSEITPVQLKRSIDRRLMVGQPMYIDSFVLAPLVSMAPMTIRLYTNQVDDGMIQTIQNVFQERVQLFSLTFFAKLDFIDESSYNHIHSE